jgi:hypothetical protein
MKIKADKIVLDIFKALAFKLPLSLIEKLADGKLTREELMSLVREISVIIGGVLIATYNKQSGDDLDPSDLEELNEV